MPISDYYGKYFFFKEKFESKREKMKRRNDSNLRDKRVREGEYNSNI